MRSKTIILILITTFFLTGCNPFEKNSNDILESAEYNGKNIAPPSPISNVTKYEMKKGEEITIYPKDVAKDLDNDEISFAPINESTLENSYLKINITKDSIQLIVKSDIEANISETFDVYITDGTYRTQMTFEIKVVEEKKEIEDNGIPAPMADPVIYNLNNKTSIEIYANELAVSIGNISIESISGNHESIGDYGTLSYYNSSKAVYTLNQNITKKEENFIIVVTNGTNTIPVNIKININ